MRSIGAEHGIAVDFTAKKLHTSADLAYYIVVLTYIQLHLLCLLSILSQGTADLPSGGRMTLDAGTHPCHDRRRGTFRKPASFSFIFFFFLPHSVFLVFPFGITPDPEA